MGHGQKRERRQYLESRDTDVIRDRLGGMTRETSCKRLTTAHRVRLVGAFRFSRRKMGLFSPCGPAPVRARIKGNRDCRPQIC
jgi:hypothetical protein